MASFNGNIDLLSLKGAKVLKGIDQKNPEAGYVCIPLGINEIKYEASRQDANKYVAKLRVNIWPFSENYKNRIRQSALERGDSNASVPTHEMQVAYSVDFIKNIIKRYPKLVEEVKESSKQYAPDIENQNPEDEVSQLFKAIQRRINYRIASLYQPQTKNNNVPQQPSYGTYTGQTAAFTPSTDNDPYIAGYDETGDILPF